MLSRRNPLYFPKIVRVRDAELVHPKHADDKRNGGIFRLDWERQKDAIALKYIEWFERWHPGKDVLHMPSLPVRGYEWTEELLFFPARGYLEDIQHYAQLAISERNRAAKPAHLLPRRHITDVTEAAVFAAFSLLADCIYDTETKYYSRKARDEIARYVLAYKFWMNQTNLSFVRVRARLSSLEDDVENPVAGCPADYIEEARTFLKDIAVHEESADMLLQASLKPCFLDKPSSGA